MQKKSCKNQTNLFAILRCKIHLSENNVGALTIVLNFHAKFKQNKKKPSTLNISQSLLPISIRPNYKVVNLGGGKSLQNSMHQKIYVVMTLDFGAQ